MTEKKATKLNRVDYRYCATCDAVVHKDHVVKAGRVGGAFWDPEEKPFDACAKGHKLEAVPAEESNAS